MGNRREIFRIFMLEYRKIKSYKSLAGIVGEGKTPLRKINYENPDILLKSNCFFRESMSVPVVLHPDIVLFLRQQKESYFQEKVWECVLKLKNQQFDSGLRVKKLKGSNKRVWEARINSASRLIFTYNKSTEPETGNPRVYLAIQDICWDHDDEIGRAHV